MKIFADRKTYLKRITTCEACPHRKKVICSKCGCVIKAKAKLEGQKCPIGKW